MAEKKNLNSVVNRDTIPITWWTCNYNDKALVEKQNI